MARGGMNQEQRAKLRLQEEKLYEIAASEIEEGKLRKGLWAKALADAQGNEKKAKGLYIDYRVRAMVDQAITDNAKLRLQKHGKKKRNQAAGWLIAAAGFWVIGIVTDSTNELTILVVVCGVAALVCYGSSNKVPKK